MVISQSIPPLCSALNLTLDSPEDVGPGEEFSVTISADSENLFDVKIFVHDSDGEKILRSNYISEVYNEAEETWDDSWYYLNEAFPNYENYKIRVSNVVGAEKICLRLRDSSKKDSGFEQTCNDITLLEKEPAEKNEEKDEKITSSEETISFSETIKEEVQQLSNQPDERIVLNSKSFSEATLVEKTTTSESNKRKILIYGFTGFCILIIILLAMRKL